MFKSVEYVLPPLWLGPLCPVNVTPEVLISIVEPLFTFTFIVPPDVLYWPIIPTSELERLPAKAVMLAPFLIYISSPFPVPGTVIVGIVIASTVGGTKTGVTGLKFIACGKLGCVAVSGVTVGAVNTLGLIPALTSNATIGSFTFLKLAIP